MTQAQAPGLNDAGADAEAVASGAGTGCGVMILSTEAPQPRQERQGEGMAQKTMATRPQQDSGGGEKKLQQDPSVQRDLAAKQQAEAGQRPSQTN